MVDSLWEAWGVLSFLLKETERSQQRLRGALLVVTEQPRRH